MQSPTLELTVTYVTSTVDEEADFLLELGCRSGFRASGASGTTLSGQSPYDREVLVCEFPEMKSLRLQRRTPPPVNLTDQRKLQRSERDNLFCKANCKQVK